MRPLTILVLSIALSGSLQGQTPGTIFDPAPGSPVVTGEGPGEVILEDINGDGRLDLLTRHLLQRMVTVHIGDGAGRFATAADGKISLGYQPGDFDLGDVNGDKILDLGLTISERDAVDILLGNGRGGFTRAAGSPFTVTPAVEFHTGSLRIIDINEDGKLDLVTANHRRNSFCTMFGNGNGGFSAGPSTSFQAGHNSYKFVFDDMNRDGHLDVVLASGHQGDDPEPGRVVIMSGDGKGVFRVGSMAPMPVPSGPHFLTLSDMNGDGRPDVLISHSNDQVSILLNDGQGRIAPAPASPYEAGTSVFGIAGTDVNGDRRNDLVMATVESITVLISGKNGFAPAPGSPFKAGPGTYSFAMGDVNKDGKVDIAASSFEGKAVTLLLGR